MHYLFKCNVLPYMWFNKRGRVEFLALVSCIHVPGNCILFESVPMDGNVHE